jgi:hypothetical protein
MKRLLVLIGAVVTLAIPASAQAITTVERIPFETTILLCNGGVVDLEGQLSVTTTSTTTPAGGFVFAIHFQPQGVKGIDITTGTAYIATGLTRDLVVSTPPGGFTETYVNRFHIQATTGAESYIVTELFHITFSSDGTIRVVIDKFSAPC